MTAISGIGGITSIVRATVDAVGTAGGAGAATPGAPAAAPATPAGGIGSIGGVGSTPDASSTGNSFLDALGNALGELNTQVNGADASMASFAAGGSADIHTVMLDLQQASIGLKTGIAVRDKLLEAYQELMRIQV
jgi:flagellar hook-basal body complex protein FliE